MAQNLQERAHLTFDRDAYAEGWERIFGAKCDCGQYENQVCDKCRKIVVDTEEKD